MTEVKTNLYEGLFLLNQASLATDFAGVVAHVKEIFNRADAEVIHLAKWDDRRLAYEINGQRRGFFVLAHFNARGTMIANIERDCNLSEHVLRVIITRGEHLGETEMEAFKSAPSLDTEVTLRETASEASEAPATQVAAQEKAPVTESKAKEAVETKEAPKAQAAE